VLNATILIFKTSLRACGVLGRSEPRPQVFRLLAPQPEVRPKDIESLYYAIHGEPRDVTSRDDSTPIAQANYAGWRSRKDAESV
jgi:hypothetical protein